jgi:preflagellin peptidase FlaK
MQTLFTAARVTLTLSFLLYASWSDYKTREVSNRVWAIFAPIALALTLAELLLYNPQNLTWFAISFGVTASFALLLFYAGGFGGADSKAFMCIALALPFFPQTLVHPFFPDGVSPLAQNIFPFTILSNSILVAAATVIAMILLNAKWRITTGKKLFGGTLATESLGKKILVLVTGYKMPIAKLKEKWHVYPLEDVEEGNDGEPLKRKLVVVPRDEGRDAIVERLSKAADAGKIDSHVLATPGLPMLIFVTVGLILALVFGDIIWLLIRFLLG